MSEEKETLAKTLLSKEFLLKQIADGQMFIEQAKRQVFALQAQIQQQVGTIRLAESILKTFDVPMEKKSE
jgi:hypothetical protein